MPVLTPSHDALNIALLALESVFERRGADFVRSWAGFDWFEVTAVPDVLRRLNALRRRLAAEGTQWI